MSDNFGPSKLKDAPAIYKALQQIASYVKDGFFDDLDMTIEQDDNGLKATLDFQFSPDEEQPPQEVAQVFTVVQTTLHPRPDKATKPLRYIERGAILDVKSETKEFYAGTGFFQVTYHHKVLGDTTGWIDAEKVEAFYPCPHKATINYIINRMLENQTIRLPQDKPAPNANAEQYLTLEELGFGKSVHYNLCGPFCVAALVGKDVIPMLGNWLCSVSLPIYHELIKNDKGLGLDPLLSMLRVNDRPAKAFTFNTGNAPLSARVLQTFLNDNKIIAGVGIDRTGAILSNGAIRHYVVLLDVYPCGTGGYVMVYNPFHNRIEQIDFDTLWQSIFASGHAAQVIIVENVKA